MNFGKVASPFFLACDWIMKLAYLNLLWFGFTIVGGIIFGIAPATASVFSIVRKWMEGDGDISITKFFWNTFRKEFLKVNLLGFILLIIGGILIFDIYFFLHLEGIVSQILTILFVFVLINFIIVLLYIFPVYVHYDLKVLQYLKFTIIVALSNPLQSLLMGVLVVSSAFIVLWNSALVLFFSVAPLSMILMLITYRIFQKLEKIKEESCIENTASIKS
ncbi:YesL family protein [Evansella tamaricis]|uniref:YesL family protein n=1 Tax=Evansella tamaricis TaxID=2069301 RepID=A0ABS6JD78_9BACI|nr:YesL family protein [Evansella tamaricis]MBU9711627.1 YesL family protein [Evansella tamaricis]